MPRADSDRITAEVTDLLQLMIRNACVNDGTPGSGNEWRSVEILSSFLNNLGLDVEIHESLPGRQSLVARLPGSDPAGPTLMLMGHTDVVPVSLESWQRDPFGAELVDGWVWGRGAIDMLNLTASMAVAVRRVATRGFRPRGTLIFFAPADEEGGGALGTEWLARHHADSVRADYVVSEWGGVPIDTPAGRRLWIEVGEKGTNWYRLRVRGTPAHGSRPYGSDNALVKAAAIVQRIAHHQPPAHVHEVWQRFVRGMGIEAEITDRLLDESRIMDGIARIPPSYGRIAHACTHLTMAPTVAHAGTKTNVIPDLAEIEIDVRSLPGQTSDDIRQELEAALGGLHETVEIEPITESESTSSPLDTPLWDALARAAHHLMPGAVCVPTLGTGGTDARFLRELGATAYGFGLFSPRMTQPQFQAMFHGNDERVDQDSLLLSTQLWEFVIRDLLT